MDQLCINCCNKTAHLAFDRHPSLCNVCYNKTYKRCSSCDVIYDNPIFNFKHNSNKCLSCYSDKIPAGYNPILYCIFCANTSDRITFQYSNKICDKHAAHKWRLCPTCMIPKHYTDYFIKDSRCIPCSRERVRQYAIENGLESFKKK
jgi:hypothetical protein